MRRLAIAALLVLAACDVPPPPAETPTPDAPPAPTGPAPVPALSIEPLENDDGSQSSLISLGRPPADPVVAWSAFLAGLEPAARLCAGDEACRVGRDLLVNTDGLLVAQIPTAALAGAPSALDLLNAADFVSVPRTIRPAVISWCTSDPQRASAFCADYAL